MKVELTRWHGWPWENDRRLECEVLRSHAALLREQAAQLREAASITRWYSERERDYREFLLAESAALCAAAQRAGVSAERPSAGAPPSHDRHLPSGGETLGPRGNRTRKRAMA